MSYPKRQPVQDKETERSQKLSHKKDQLKNLLVNKFRGKYNVTAESNDFDRVIKQEVEKFLETEQLTEANLINLDKKFQKLAPQSGVTKNVRGSMNGSFLNGLRPQQHVRGSNDYSDSQSKHSSVSRDSKRSQLSKSTIKTSERSRSTVIKDTAAAILSPADDHWNKIVMFNVDSYNKELEEAKQRVRDNQFRMKEDLEKQVVLQRRLKEEEKRKEKEYMLQMQQISEEAQRKEREKQEQLRRRLQQEKEVRDKQLIDNKTKKEYESQVERQQELERRAKMDREAQEQAQNQKNKIDTYKQQCQGQFEENKRLKEIQRQLDEQGGKKVPEGQDLLGQLFQQRTHISYERREKNDKQIELIKDKIVGDAERRRRQEEIATEQLLKEKLAQQAKDDEMRRKALKQKELATKQYLDLQMQEKEQRVSLLKSQEKNEGSYIHQDVQAFRDQERQKKEEVERIMKNHKLNLEKQIETGKSKDQKMAPQEYQLNKKLIEAIEQKSPSPETKIRKPF